MLIQILKLLLLGENGIKLREKLIKYAYRIKFQYQEIRKKNHLTLWMLIYCIFLMRKNIRRSLGKPDEKMFRMTKNPKKLAQR